MKKSFISFSFISLTLAFVLCLTSCFNLFSRSCDNDDEATACFTGYINVNSILGSDFIITDSAQRSARPQSILISETDSNAEYKYKIEVTKIKDEDGNTYISPQPLSETPDIDYANHCFELSDLSYGEWKVDVSIIKKADNTEILSDSCTATLNSVTSSFKHDFFLKPVTEGTGTINLAMNVPSSIAKMDVKILEKPEESTLVNDENLLPSSGPAFVYNKSSLKTGTYKLRFTFKKADNTIVFETVQAINVLNGLTTNKWVGDTSTLIKSDGTFVLTKTLIELWGLHRTEYYVGGSGAADTNYGSQLDPLSTVNYAISLVNDISYENTEVKIHMADETREAISYSLRIKTGKKVLIDWQTPSADESKRPALLRVSQFSSLLTQEDSGSMLITETGAELTIDGISINGNNLTGNHFRGVTNYGTFTLKSGFIENHTNIYSTNAAGIYNSGTLNLEGGTIYHNSLTNTASVGDGVYSSGTINLKGAVTIKDNGSTNLYLASGKKINIAGTLTQGTNKSDIYVSSETVPSKNTPVVFTNNYGYNNGYNNAIDPDKYFTGDKFVVTFLDASDENNPGEAVFKTNDATIKHVLSDMNITFKLSKKKFIPGTASEITITPKITIKETIQGTSEIIDYTENALADTDSPLIWNVKMYLGSKVITDCTFDSETKTLTIPATVTSTETFTLFISATYRGMTFSEEFVLNQYNPGMINVQGTTWGSDSTPLSPASSVFISNREFTIPSLIVSEHEVTQEEYERYCNYGSTAPSDTYGKGANYPAYFVSWYDALIYCNLRSWAEGLTPVYSFPTNTQWHPQYWSGRNESSGKYCGPSTEDDNWNNIVCHWDANGWRLPTEAEWEYLARTGNTESYTYSGSNNIDDVAWYNNNSDNKTHEVKTKNPNGFELYDMSGNVWEWCWDPFSATLTEAPLSGPENGNINRRTNRGGSFDYADERCTVENRNEHGDLPSTRNQCLGFRIVRNAD